jgi:hypothetical protein
MRKRKSWKCGEFQRMAIVRRQPSLLRSCGVESDTARRDERNPVVASSMHPVLQMISNKRRTGVTMYMIVLLPISNMLVHSSLGCSRLMQEVLCCC